MQNTTTISVARVLLNRIQAWVRRHTCHFNCSDFWPGRELKQAAIVLAAWALPAIVGVVVTDWLGRYRSVRYLQISIQEGIGPHIWNVFGVLGMVLTGFLIAVPRQKWLAIAAYQVMLNTYALGALMFGLLLGKWICVIVPQDAYSLVTVTRSMFAVAIFLNLLIWYVAFLVSPARLDTGFMRSVAQTKPQFRLPFALAIVLIAIASLYVCMDK
ncbi:hypothetical protein LFL96_01210 [Paraburkholderia sp. D15]|uniref:hypothetical protein n=1 Tax=Paraburkholderia sp. D15 TaxID=2880218 RepID=UPI00247AF1FA|nr:hypothetical protein [Paraburkholderia sp. D15]WGS50156.1 hypothetical protein LFL96_01210 [Paraburkholderia sp. D15]